MKFCIPHWDKLREAIEKRGLSSLVARDGEAAIERLLAEAEGTATPATYDPLMAAHNMVIGRAIELGGLYLMTGDFCPVCEAIKHRAGVVDPKVGRPFTAAEEEAYWIDGPADAVRAYCVEQKLIPGVQ